ncbi:hypothetical protein PFISCL1PPCAC_12079, partial [Pristionchus fissidentatus]
VSIATTNSYGWCSSGYGTCSSLSDEDLQISNGEEEESEANYLKRKEEEKGVREEEVLQPGICPHCKHIYKKPMTLQCGHSLCNHCCIDLLSRMDGNSSSNMKIRPRMGLSSYSRTSVNKALTSSWSSLNGFSSWKSPRCTVCGEPPKKTAPVPNLSLDAFLTTIRHLYNGNERLDSSCISSSSTLISSLSPSLQSTPSSLPSSRVSIRDCTVSIVGSKGSGKSSLVQSQLCNDMLIDELLGRRKKMGEGDSPLLHDNSHREGEQGGGVTYMLKLVETGDLAEKISLSMGVVVVYSIIDRESFHDAKRLLSIFSGQRGVQMPMVLVGTKSDLTKRRVVDSYEGQQLAKEFNCPFIEVSSRRNQCVNEAFIELVQLMDSRGL